MPARYDGCLDWIARFMNSIERSPPKGLSVSSRMNGEYPGLSIKRGSKLILDFYAHAEYIRGGVRDCSEAMVGRLGRWKGVEVRRPPSAPYLTLYIRSPEGIAAIRSLLGMEAVSASNLDSNLLNLAGEYRVCSELLKRGIFGTVTYGNRKGADVYAIGEARRKVLKIEVKTSQRGRFVTSITQKELDQAQDAPDFWVLFALKANGSGEYDERFFVLSHEEICQAQSAHNSVYAGEYQAKHRRAPDLSKGVDNVRIEDVKDHAGRWDKIVCALTLA